MIETGKTVGEIVLEYLIENVYDGLSGDGCGCRHDDNSFMACYGEFCCECSAARFDDEDDVDNQNR